MPYRPGDPYPLLAVAWQHYLKGDRQQAIHWAMRAAVTVPNGPRRAAGVELWRWWQQPTEQVLADCRQLVDGWHGGPVGMPVTHAGQGTLF